MNIKLEQLSQHLQHNLASVYCVSGDEILQSMEAVDQIRLAANQAGYLARDILTVEGKFDWSVLHRASESLSLFSEKQIIDLRIPSGKPGAAGSKAIQAYLAKIPDDKLLIIQMGKVDYRSKKTKWFKAIEAAGISIQVWPLSPPQTLAWIAKRIKQAGLSVSQDAVQLLSRYVEGNLVAASQEIQKLYTIFGSTQISEQQLLEAITDCSHYSLFDLVDAILSAQPKRVRHILDVLQQENMPLPLLLWAMTDLGRKLYQANFALRAGKTDAAMIRDIPRNKQSLYKQANQRLYHADWLTIWTELIEVDWKSKGVGANASKHPARIWDEIADIALKLAGA
jgi:DNA polymerase-3 subunit delta